MITRFLGAAAAIVTVGGNLVACQPLAAAPLPTPQAIHVQISPSLRPWASELHDCAVKLPGAGLVLDERPASALDPLQADLSLRFGGSPGENQYAAAIGEEALDLIVHPSNPLDELALSDLQGIYSGSLGSWNDVAGSPEALPGKAIQVWSYAPGDDVRAAFDAAVLGGKELTPTSFLAPSPQAALEAVSEDPAAIGFIPHRWTTSSVRAVTLTAGDGLLRQPILALAAKEPQGQARQLLVCLQTPR